MQSRLNRVSKNYPAIPKVTVDGIYGPATKAAVKAFQKIFGLTQDGIVGQATWYQLERIYVAVKKLAELQSEGFSYADQNAQFPSALQMGMRGSPIAVLQHRLDLVGAFYDTIPDVAVDGIFGEGTKEAVIAFQNRFGLNPDGIVGKATWNKLYQVYQDIVRSELLLSQQDLPLAFNGEVLRVGSRGERVRLLQEYLNTIGTVWEIPRLPVTGYFGDDTRNAVRLFQDLFNLPPDGIVGKQTWDAITSLYTDVRTGLMRVPGQYPGNVLKEGD